MAAIDDIIERVREYLPDEDLSPLRRAGEFAEKIYTGNHRLSGQPYLGHALGVASILARLKLDLNTIVAGLLHGALKDPASVPEKELAETRVKARGLLRALGGEA